MAHKAGILVAAVLLSGPALAQGSASTGQAVPDSNMAAPSAGATGANNGIGHQGSLTGDAGSHSSTVKGPEAAAQLGISPKPTGSSRDDPKLEGGQNQGGTAQH